MNVVLKCVEVHCSILSVAFSCQLGPAMCLRLCLQDDVLTDFREVLLSTVDYLANPGTVTEMKSNHTLFQMLKFVICTEDAYLFGLGILLVSLVYYLLSIILYRICCQNPISAVVI